MESSICSVMMFVGPSNKFGSLGRWIRSAAGVQYRAMVSDTDGQCRCESHTHTAENRRCICVEKATSISHLFEEGGHMREERQRKHVRQKQKG